MLRHLLRSLCLQMRSLRTLQDLRRLRLRRDLRLLAWLGLGHLSAGDWSTGLAVWLGLTWL